ncbi:hypothetical protein [Zunongwangia endophytica]|uniref:Lipocalin-like domain-containing protein n=1 Tax=Zunongwangia endophytica TaxID=1808945 RepID=A0ABV8H7U6_9FLAO|nr:hypothetical protein [Zunongwangia endophytica]MDN3595614.1 hypothetical protein [Zunongwangia endophytica]
MKNFRLSLIVLILFTFSCSSDDEEEFYTKDFEINEFPQEWKLVRSISGFDREVSEGEELSTTQVYKFNKDQIFVKKVILDQETYIGEGVYELVEDDQGRWWFYLTYTKKGGAVDSCLAESDKEQLYFNTETVELQGGSPECDGPLLYFKRIK